jgi:Tol biopolymer transport system component
VTDEGHRRLEQLFEEGLGVHARDRASWLDRVCGGDMELRAELGSLLDNAAGAPDFIEQLRQSMVEPAVRGLLDPDADESGEMPDPFVGRTVAHYRIVERIGSGGLGMVYRARDTVLDRSVALKFLAPELGRDPAAKRRFLAEARAASALDHVNICAVHDVGETEEGRVFICMPHYRGRTLADRIRGGRLDIAEVRGVAIQVARALATAHDRGIVHRDVKPANVFVTSEDVVKLLDFGLARSLDATLSQSGARAGTVAYMSPEQASGRQVDARTDVWALGVMTYEMLTGVRPFRGDDAQAVIHAILNTEPAPIRRLRRGIPADLARFVRKAMEVEPAHRFPDGGVALAALERRTGQGVSWRTDLRGTGRRLVRRRSTRFTIGTIAVGAAVVASIQLRRFTPPPAVVAEPRQVTFSGDVLEASVSASGEQVAYTSQRGDTTVLSTVDAVRGENREVLLRNGFLCCPAWSPDGSKLAYRTAEGTFVQTLDPGAAPRRVTAQAISAWTPTGSHLYAWWPQARELILSSVARDSVVEVPFTMEHDWIEGVHWSPGDDRLAVAVLTASGSNELWTMEADGRASRLLLRDSIHLHSPWWSPGGDAIYYYRAETPDALWKLPVSADGASVGPAVRVMGGLSARVRNSSIPAFSLAADGNRLVYVRDSGFSNLWSIPVGGSPASPHPLTHGTSRLLTPRISSDGSMVAYIEEAGNRWRLLLRPIDGTTESTVISSESLVWNPAWSPDGRTLAFGVLVEGQAVLQIVDLADRSLRTLPAPGFAARNYIRCQLADDRSYALLDPETGQTRPLPGLADEGWAYEPVAAPTGEWVAIWWNRPDTQGLWLVSLVDTSSRFLGAGRVAIGWRGVDSLFVMSDVGRREGGGRSVFLVPVEGGAPRPLMDLPGNAEPWNVAVSSDGSRIVAALEETQSDVWIVDHFDPTGHRER